MSEEAKEALQKESESLAEELKGYRESYYNLSPVVPDSTYDAKKDRLKQVCLLLGIPSHPEVTTVGASPPTDSVWEKVRHEIPMGSLDKANTPSEFRKWVSDTRASKFHITHKIDGSSMELVYEKGELMRCVTRGDGTIGEDVTKNIRQVPTVLRALPAPMDVTVRGEIVMLKEVFREKYSEIYANPRNTAAAKVREKKRGGADCANLEFVAYWAKCDARPASMSEMFAWLSGLGFQTPPFLSGSADDIERAFSRATEGRQDVAYDIDGQVVSVDDISELESLGEVSMCPRGQIAWKFDSEKAQTKLLDVAWQIGPTGRVTPVAKVEPVRIGGVTIESVSLHNMKMFAELKLFRGCRVLVERRNDVIPYISKNLDAEAA